MSLLSLNEDCVHLICEFLELEDLVTLANTCEYLRSIVKTQLRLSKSLKVNQKFWHQLCSYEPDVKSFISNFSKNINELELNGMNRMQFDIASKLELPNITSLNIKHVNRHSIYRPDETLTLIEIIENTSESLKQLTLIDCFWHDLNLLRHCEFPKVDSVRVLCKFDFVEDYGKITKIFPGIKKLSIMAPITSRTLWNLKNLEELEITLDEFTFSIISFITDPGLDRLHLRKLSILKNRASCRDRHRYFDFINFFVLFDTIEELQIDCHATLSLSFFLMQRKKVRKVTFTYENLFFCNCGHEWLWTDIAGRNKFRNLVESLTINSYLLRKCPNLKKFMAALKPKIRRLSIFDRYSTGEDQFRHDHLDFKAQLLEEIPNFMIKSLRWQNSVEELRAELLVALATFERWETFDVSANICDLQFLKDAIEALRQRNDSRSFHMRCYNTKISKCDLEQISLPAGLKISLENREFVLPEIDSVEVEFAKTTIHEEVDHFLGMLLMPF